MGRRLIPTCPGVHSQHRPEQAAVSQASWWRVLSAFGRYCDNLRAWKLPHSTQSPQGCATSRDGYLMAEASKASYVVHNGVILALLESVVQGVVSSPSGGLASELGVAPGLAKGLVKLSQAPARRYAYCLIPLGFTEKSQLTFEFMSHSFTCSGRRRSIARSRCKRRGYTWIAVLGGSDLAEVAPVCALGGGFVISSVVDPSWRHNDWLVPVVRDIDLMVPRPDGVLITEMYSSAMVQNVICEIRRRTRSLAGPFGCAAR